MFSIFVFIYLFIHLFIYFIQLNDELDAHNKKVFWLRKLQFKNNSPDKIILFSIDNSSEKLQEKIKAR